jgi:hypothetical protein
MEERIRKMIRKMMIGKIKRRKMRCKIKIRKMMIWKKRLGR